MFLTHKRAVILAAAAGAAALGTLFHLRRSMDAAEVVRKLSGMRTAAALFKLSRGFAPADFYDIVRDGHLQAPPELKLGWHRRTSEVRHAPALRARDTGGWGYVNVSGNRNFGTVFIDCVHRDEKGRWWSEF